MIKRFLKKISGDRLFGYCFRFGNDGNRHWSFLVDAKVVPGGVSGLAMAIHYLTGLSVGMLIWIFNIPLFLWGLKELGKQFGMRTFVGFTFELSIHRSLPRDIPGFHYIRFQDSATIQDLYKNDFLFDLDRLRTYWRWSWNHFQIQGNNSRL